ncbi:MAG: hypothetical protein ABI158_06360 [Edaphobacter sp.]
MQHRMFKGLKIILFVIVAAVVLGFVTRELWNNLLPQIFGWSRITFWQSIGLLLLSRILFGGFHRHSGHRDQWKHRMKERWEHMTPEDRERFRKGMRCNPFASSDPQPVQPVEPTL